MYVSVGERGPEEGINKAASNLSQRAAICLGLSPVWELRAREREAQTGLAPEKSRGQRILGGGARALPRWGR